MQTCNRPIEGTSARCALPLGHDPGRACEPGVVTLSDALAFQHGIDLSAYLPTKPNRAGRRRGR